jgi:activating signal cointegrator complex subunit 3
VRQAYKQFIGAVVELLNGEAVSEELQQVAQAVYRLFGDDAAEPDTGRRPLQKRYMLLCSECRAPCFLE